MGAATELTATVSEIEADAGDRSKNDLNRFKHREQSQD